MNDEQAGGEDVLDRLAAGLAREQGAAALAGAAPQRESRALLLRLARDIAHATERQNAPLATYLVGRYVEQRRREGVGEAGALAEAAAVLARVTGPPAP
jgi:Domain of unknown function (DUF6457)